MFEELKQRHAAMWGSGRFELVAESLDDMHRAIVTALDAAPGEDWLDVGCGTGELTRHAIATGANVIGADISPALVDTARRQADEWGTEVTFVVGDAEALPFDAASFDVVSSSVGAIFAPNHDAVAAELARVTRPGGRLALSAWATGGEIDEFFALIGSYAPPPPPGAGSSMQWGNPEYCLERLGDAFELVFEDRNTPWIAESGQALWDLMLEGFGPIRTLHGTLEPERATSFREEMIALFEGIRTDDGIFVDRPYLLVTGVRQDT